MIVPLILSLLMAQNMHAHGDSLTDRLELEKQQSAAQAQMFMMDMRVKNKDQEQNRRRSLLQSNPYPQNAAPPGTTTSTGLLVYTPVNSSFLDGDEFAQFFYDNYNGNNAIKGIFLTPGNYRVTVQQLWKAWVLYFSCWDNQNRGTFELNMVNTTIYIGDRDRGGIGIDGCQNFTLRGPTVTYALDSQVFTQGTITNLGTNSDVWTFQVDPGYPTSYILDNGGSHLAVLYNPRNGQLKQNASDIYAGPFTPVANTTGLYTIPGADIPNMYPGMRMVIRGDTAATHVTFCNVCSNFRMLDTTIWSSNIFGVLEAWCYNSTYNNVRVVPDPTRRNRPQPIFSSNADGIHSVLPSYGPQITNSVVLNTGDDSIAVNGVYYVVAAVNATGTSSRRNVTFGSWNCGDPSCLTVKVGTRMQIYTADSRSLGYAVVKSVENVPQPINATGQSPTYPAFNYDYATYFAATFTSWPSNWTTLAAQDAIVTNPASCGNNAIIVNNTVGNNRARGIYVKFSNSVVANNNVTGSSAVGIFLSPDNYFLEADWNANVNVTSNYVNVTNAGIFLSSTNLTLQAAIYQNHRNVRITGNTIQGSIHPIIVGSATAVTVSGNAIVDGCCYPWYYGDIFYNQGQGNLVYISYTTSSTFSGNVFRTNTAACRQYGNYNSPYLKGPGASTVKTS